jgi:transcriptional regulator with XRE-family HTH domain
MNLKTYLSTLGSDSDIGRRVGLDRSTVSRIRRGLIDPPVSTAERIVRLTGGSITIEPPSQTSDLPQVVSPAGA